MDYLLIKVIEHPLMLDIYLLFIKVMDHLFMKVVDQLLMYVIHGPSIYVCHGPYIYVSRVCRVGQISRLNHESHVSCVQG